LPPYDESEEQILFFIDIELLIYFFIN